MQRRVAVLQSNYIPWKGYFDIVHDVDLFIFHDDLQYTKGDWRNRNRIKTPRGAEWLTIPVGTREDRLICEVRLTDGDWARRHWRQIERHYRRAPYFALYAPVFEDLYLRTAWETLSQLNQHVTRLIARDLLGLRTELRDSREYRPEGRKLDRLLDLLRKAGATSYVSGPSARAYIDPSRFDEIGVELVWKDYSGYPEYPQFFAPFQHQVTVLDLLFHAGPAAPHFIWGWREESAAAKGLAC